MGAVLFTLVVQGEPLVRWLGLDRLLLADRLARLEGDFAAKHGAVDRLPELLSNGLFPGGVAMRLLSQYERKIARIRTEIEDLHKTELDNDDQLRLLLHLRALTEEKSLYVDMFTKGQLSERSFRQLSSRSSDKSTPCAICVNTMRSTLASLQCMELKP